MTDRNSEGGGRKRGKVIDTCRLVLPLVKPSIWRQEPGLWTWVFVKCMCTLNLAPSLILCLKEKEGVRWWHIWLGTHAARKKDPGSSHTPGNNVISCEVGLQASLCPIPSIPLSTFPSQILFCFIKIIKTIKKKENKAKQNYIEKRYIKRLCRQMPVITLVPQNILVKNNIKTEKHCLLTHYKG